MSNTAPFVPASVAPVQSAPTPEVTPISPPAVGAGSSFTSTPIDVTEPARAEPQKTEPARTDPEPLVSALAKANSEARALKKQTDTLNASIADFKAQLAAAQELGAKTTAAEAALAEIIAKPRLLLQKGKTFEEILNDLASPDEPVDPRLAAIEAKLTEREKADAAAAEQRAKDDAARSEQDEQAAKERGKANITALITSEGDTPDGAGVPRWAVLGSDAGRYAEVARDKVIAYLAESKVNVTHEQAVDLVRQCLDQMEKLARDELSARTARLQPKPVLPNSNVPNLSYSEQPSTPPMAQSRPAPSTVDADVRGTPLPPPQRAVSHGFTGLLR